MNNTILDLLCRITFHDNCTSFFIYFIISGWFHMSLFYEFVRDFHHISHATWNLLEGVWYWNLENNIFLTSNYQVQNRSNFVQFGLFLRHLAKIKIEMNVNLYRSSVSGSLFRNSYWDDFLDFRYVKAQCIVVKIYQNGESNHPCHISQRKK